MIEWFDPSLLSKMMEHAGHLGELLGWDPRINFVLRQFRSDTPFEAQLLECCDDKPDRNVIQTRCQATRFILQAKTQMLDLRGDGGWTRKMSRVTARKTR